MRLMTSVLCALALAGAFAACGSDGTGPDADSNSIAVQAGDVQFGTRSSTLLEPLQVIVTDPVSKKPRSGVQVQWIISAGTGASLTASTSTTDSKGVASTQLRLGDALGTYGVEARTEKLVGGPARFTARAVEVPAITSVNPNSVAAGDTVTITGQNFSATPDDNIVLFGGFRGKVVTATTTQLRVVVPLCVPSRSIGVQAALGAVAGNQLTIAVNGNTASALQLARGEVRSFADANELACFRLPGGVAGLKLLLMPQNHSQVVGSFTAVQLAGLTGGPITTIRVTEEPFVAPHAVDDWELQLRRKERELLRGPNPALRPQTSVTAAACSGAITVGSRCDFQVINKSSEFQRVVGEVKAITTRAIIYQDITAPTVNGLTTADFEALGDVFDDPIYSAVVAVYGSPSDLDRNGKVMVLLTPVVNALTDRGSSGFIGAFFYGCDLLSRSSCTGSNEAEIFYGLTADPNGQFSDARSRDAVMRTLPSVLAHEFQHMINFFQRSNSTDALWLSEGLAHHAEDVVADVFAARGDQLNANLFRQQNSIRANRFLRATASTSLLAEDEVGTLELRGGAWLFVKYLAEHYGSDILGRITRSTQSSVTNVTAQTNKSWSALLSDWGIALWADDAPELAGVSVSQVHTYPSINLRQRLANSDGSYPLRPTVYSFEDFVHTATLSASSQTYLIVQAGATSPQLNLSMSGQHGGAFATNALPQMTIMRIN